MANEKRYRLLKDLPDANAGDTYNFDGRWLENQSRNAAILIDYLWAENHPGYFEEILPESSKEFCWTDELVQDCIKYAMKVSPTIEDVSRWVNIQHFKQYHKQKSPRQYPLDKVPEKIEVTNFGRHNHCSTINVWQFATSQEIPKEKYQAIKDVIEATLNGYQPISKVEHLKGQINAFNAAREKKNMITYTYPRALDYINK